MSSVKQSDLEIEWEKLFNYARELGITIEEVIQFMEEYPSYLDARTVLEKI